MIEKDFCLGRGSNRRPLDQSTNGIHLRRPPILRIGDQVLTFDVFWPKDLQEVRSTVYIHVQSI